MITTIIVLYILMLLFAPKTAKEGTRGAFQLGKFFIEILEKILKGLWHLLKAPAKYGFKAVLLFLDWLFGLED